MLECIQTITYSKANKNTSESAEFNTETIFIKKTLNNFNTASALFYGLINTNA